MAYLFYVFVISRNEVPDPRLEVSPLRGTVPLTVVADSSASSDADGDRLIFDWYVNDENVDSDGPVLRHTISQSGQSRIRVRVSDGTTARSEVAIVEAINEHVVVEKPPQKADLKIVSLVGTSNLLQMEVQNLGPNTATAVSVSMQAQQLPGDEFSIQGSVKTFRGPSSIGSGQKAIYTLSCGPKDIFYVVKLDALSDEDDPVMRNSAYTFNRASSDLVLDLGRNKRRWVAPN